MRPDLRPPAFAGITLILFRREFMARLLSPWLYTVASAACLVAWLYGGGFLQTFETESVLVTTDPLLVLNIVIVVFLAVILGLRLASSIAGEREHRTLEVLIVGPVPYGAIVMSKFAAEVCIFALLMGVYFAYLLVAQPLGAGVIGMDDALGAGRMPASALPVLALGLLVSAWARSVLMAVVIYLSVVVLLVAVEVVSFILNSRPPDQLTLAEAYIRNGLNGLDTVIGPISAGARLTDLVEAMAAQAPLSLTAIASALALTAATLVAATWVARLRGTFA